MIFSINFHIKHKLSFLYIKSSQSQIFLFQSFTQFLKNFLNFLLTINMHNFPFLLIMFHNTHSLTLKSLKPLPQYLLIIIRSLTSLSSFQASLQHGIFRTIQKYNKRHLNFIFNNLSPNIQILLISRKPINQKPTIFPSFFLHSLLQ